MNLTLKRTPGIYLVGFMGCGKSTVGKALASALGWRFLDLDEQIEQRAAAAISTLFAERGEDAFRVLEHQALTRLVRAIECGQPAVVALGGGAFAQPQNRDLLRDRGLSVWLDCPLETVRSRVAGDPARPLAQDPERFDSLYELRRPAYSLADIQVQVSSDDAAAIAARILSHPKIR